VWGVVEMRCPHLVVLLLAALAPATAAAPAARSLEGTIAAVAPGGFTVTVRDADVRVVLTPETVLLQRRRVGLQDIRRNDFVGVTARREMDGTLTAIAINIFPPEFRGRIRQAQFVMETGNVMTNAVVLQNVRRVEGRTLYLRLDDSSTVIAVPPDAVVLRLTLIPVSQLRPGMSVIVRGTAGPDGTVAATSVTVDAPLP
jgi:hypothetical protein